MTPPPGESIRVERFINASLERVRNAWMDPALVARWFGPVGRAVDVHTYEARPGGAYEIAMHAPDDTHIANGKFIEVTDSRLVFTWNWRGHPMPRHTEVTVEFHAEANGTRLVIIEHGLPTPEQAAHHLGGWASILESLAMVLVGAGPAGTMND